MRQRLELNILFSPGVGILQFYRDLRVVLLLFFQPVFWGRACCGFSGTPAWAELPCPLSGGWDQWKLDF